MPGQITWAENFRILQSGTGHSPQAGHGPALVVYNNFLYMVYVGEGNKHLWFMRLTSTNDFQVWQNNQQVETAQGEALESGDRPALAVANNGIKDLLYMVYQRHGGTGLNFASYDGNQWTDLGPLPDSIQHPLGAGQDTVQQTEPYLCTDTAGNLHLAYHAYLQSKKPDDPGQNHILHSTFNPLTSSWSEPDSVDAPFAHPSIIQVGESFALTSTVAANRPDSGILHFASGVPGAWNGFLPLTQGGNYNLNSNTGGVMVQLNGLLYFIYIGESNRNVGYAWMGTDIRGGGLTSNGVLGHDRVEANQKHNGAAETSAPISAAVINGELCVAYKGESSDNVWFAHGH